MIDELEGLIEQVGRRGFMVHAFRADLNGPDLLAAVYEYAECADVVILIDEDHACAYRTPRGPAIDVFAPVHVYWSYASSPVWTLRALLTLAEPGSADAPRWLAEVPSSLGVPAAMRRPVRMWKRGN